MVQLKILNKPKVKTNGTYPILLNIRSRTNSL